MTDDAEVNIHPMHEDRHDNIFADDDALDFIIYEELEKQDRERKGGKGVCLGIVVLLLLPSHHADSSPHKKYKKQMRQPT